MKKTSKYPYFFLIALILHGLLLGYFLVSFQRSIRPIGRENGTLLNTYLVLENLPRKDYTSMNPEQMPSMNRQAVPKKPTPPQEEKVADKGYSLKKITQLQEKTPANQSSQAKSPARKRAVEQLSRGERNRFLELLNHAIAMHEQYPPDAQFFRQKGTVTLFFVMTPDGTVKKAHILHSSGFNSLDQSALDGLLAVSPFSEAHQFLKTTQSFTINIIFHL